MTRADRERMRDYYDRLAEREWTSASAPGGGGTHLLFAARRP